ncbi:MAG: exopolysaccharide biosynthesis [Rickettsiaceae bacterium]|nr:exopolysaccharide biosynthesis [Rickettsiaceae bacterium]
MSVYNGLPYLEKAVNSILNQTFTDFEFLIIDDCSTDGSLEILEKFAAQDNRIFLHKNQTRQGLGANLRNGVNLAKGEWIARMDADDIALPHRLQTQIDFALANPEIDIIGSFATDISEHDEPIGQRKMPTEHSQITKYIWTCPIIHPTVFMRKSSLVKAGSYGNEKRRQDYALWFRCAKAGLHFANIPENLLQYRFADEYFRKNNFKALITQVKIGWKGCYLVGASPMSYIGVAVPLIKGILPRAANKIVTKILKKVDPRYN